MFSWLNTKELISGLSTHDPLDMACWPVTRKACFQSGLLWKEVLGLQKLAQTALDCWKVTPFGMGGLGFQKGPQSLEFNSEVGMYVCIYLPTCLSSSFIAIQRSLSLSYIA